ncbi:hypothetical protein TRVL_07663 [Trypanosoma vivax]|nr:hypothetical protein TRVL_07663 [Trypanosoma vivax]
MRVLNWEEVPKRLEAQRALAQCPGLMLECLYPLFSASPIDKEVIVEPQHATPPMLIVATLPSAHFSRVTLQLHMNDLRVDEETQSFMSSLTVAYPSSWYLLTVDSSTETPETVVQASLTFSLPRGQHMKFCYVLFGGTKSNEVVVPPGSVFSSEWLASLRHIVQSLRSTQELVAEMIFRMGFRVHLRGLFRLIDECRWLENETFVCKLLKTAEEHFCSHKGSGGNSKTSSTLQVECIATSERDDCIDTFTHSLQVGLCLKSDPEPTPSALLSTEGVAPASHLLVVALHSCDSYDSAARSTDRACESLKELDALLKHLGEYDGAFVSLAGHVAVQPHFTAECVRRKWVEGREEALKKVVECNTTPRSKVQNMLTQAGLALNCWRRERQCGVTVAGCAVPSSAPPRAVVLFFAAHGSDCMQEFLACSQLWQPAMFRVPVFCLGTPSGGADDNYKLLYVDRFIGNRCVLSVGGRADPAGAQLDGACLVGAVLSAVRNISHLHATVVVPTSGCQIGGCLDLGPLEAASEFPLSISHSQKDAVGETISSERFLMLFAYSVARDDYDVLRVPVPAVVSKASAAELLWWKRIELAKKLLHSMPLDACHDCQIPSLRERQLVDWLQAHYRTQRLSDGSPPALVAAVHPTLVSLTGSNKARQAAEEPKQQLSIDTPASNTSCSFVDLRWTNFPSCSGSPVTTVSALLTRTLPLDTCTVYSVGKTLALESLSRNCASVRLASVKHVPALAEARSRFIAIFSVDTSTASMRLQRIVSARTREDLRGSIVHDVTNLCVQQMYCAVHVALRRPLCSSVFFQSDVLVSDGITFATTQRYVENVRITSLSDCGIELEWEGVASSVTVQCTPLQWLNVAGNCQRPSSVTDSSRAEWPTLVLQRHSGNKCVIAGLQPCTIYCLRVGPAEDDAADSLLPGLSAEWAEGVELFFGTCISVDEMAGPSLEFVEARQTGIARTLSCPIFRGIAAIASDRLMELIITPRLSMDGLPAELESTWVQRCEGGAPDRVMTTLLEKDCDMTRVSVQFDVEVCSAHVRSSGARGLDDVEDTASDFLEYSECKSGEESNEEAKGQGASSDVDACDVMKAAYRWFMSGVLPHTREVGVLKTVWNLLCAPVSTTSAECTWVGIPSARYVVTLRARGASAMCDGGGSTGCVHRVQEENETVCQIEEIIEAGSGPNCVTLRNLQPCVSYDGQVRCDNSGETLTFVLHMPPEQPSMSVANIVVDMQSLVVSVKLPINSGDDTFLSATITPQRITMDNTSGTETLLQASYAHVPKDHPIAVALGRHWRCEGDSCVSSQPTYLRAVTNLQCHIASDAEGLGNADGANCDGVVLTWTCVSHDATEPLTVLVNGEARTSTIENTLYVDRSAFPVAESITFRGALLIEGTNPIFILPMPPSLSTANCALRAISRREVQVTIDAEYCALLSRMYRAVKSAVRVLLCVNGHPTLELPLADDRVAEGKASARFLKLAMDEHEMERITTLTVCVVSILSGECSHALEGNGFSSVTSKLNGNDGGWASDEAAVLPLQPVLLIPWSTSAPFEARVTPFRSIGGLRVTHLSPTSAKLSWVASLQSGAFHEEYGVHITVRCAARELCIGDREEYVLCQKHCFMLRDLHPGTPYEVEVAVLRGDTGERVRFVTPQRVASETLQKLLCSIHTTLSQCGECNATGELEPECSASSLSRTTLKSGLGPRAVNFQMILPRHDKKYWTVSPHSAWFGLDEKNCLGPCLCVSASLQVALVASSGKLLQLWSSTEASQERTVSFLFALGSRESGARWPHIELGVESVVRHMPENGGSAQTQSVAGSSCPAKHLPLRESEDGREVAGVEAFVRRNPLPDRPKMAEMDRQLVVELLGCPQLRLLDEHFCVVEWGGSCNSYTVHWRAGPSGVVHTEFVEPDEGRSHI